MEQTGRVILLRHGMTAGNLQKRYIGVTDEPLCEEGIRMLQEAAPYSDLKQVFVSPLLRCRQTAQILFPNAGQILIPDLAEMDFGIFENRSFAGDLEYSAKYRAWVDSRCEDPVPNGECRASFEERCVKGFLEGLARAGETAAFVVHGGTIMSVLHRFADAAKEYYQWNPPNGHGFMGMWNGTGIYDIKEI